MKPYRIISFVVEQCGNFNSLYLKKGVNMITLHLFYKGANGSAKAFAEEMESSGIASAIRSAKGNLRYEYFQPLNDPETILLIVSWKNQAAIDAHHASPMMAQLAALREKYDLRMTAERFISDEIGSDEKYIRK
jgi:quinol monooxygenase YgiN